MKITNKNNYPDFLVRAISRDDYDYQPGDKTISTTALLKPAWIKNLEDKHRDDLEQDVEDLVWQFDGHAKHFLIEKSKSINDISEKRYNRGIAGWWTITGRIDLYQPGTATLWDIKETSTWSIIYGSRLEDWTRQLNIYIWIMAGNNLQVKEAKIIAKMRDWQKSKVEPDGNYPASMIKIIDVDIWPLEKTEFYILERLAAHADPQPCTPEERWASPTKYAAMKTGRKTAVKLFDSNAAAQEFINNLGNKEAGKIEIWPVEKTEAYFKEYFSPSFKKQYRTNPPKYVAIKTNRKTAVKLFDSQDAAQEFIDGLGNGLADKIEIRPGEDKRCMNYCLVKNYCSYFTSKGR